LSREEQSKRYSKPDLDRIVFIGRTFEEYVKIFSLSKEELMGKKILDCPSGACSLTAKGNKLGLDISACDIAYYHEANDLKQKGLQDIEHAMEHVKNSVDSYLWEYFEDVEALKRARLHALNESTIDMMEFPDRYFPATMPVLPFEDEEFDITLSAHFLFMYADRLDYDFHISTINELLRVTKEEIRIFPLVDLEGQRYEYLDKIKKYLLDNGQIVEEVKVPYEFQQNANSMLQIKKVF
jgi:hypothetical protein